jgi:hypothetical protein
LLDNYREETGYIIEVNYLQGIYTKYLDRYPNGDVAQTILFAFVGRIIGGAPSVDNVETKELKFFTGDHLPVLFNKQNNDMLSDYIQNLKGVYR